MIKRINRLFAAYGQDITLVRNGERTALRGFLQPDDSRTQQGMYPQATPAGMVQPGCWRYLGPAEPVLAPGDVLESAAGSFLVRRRENVYEGNVPLYQWGLCHRKGGEDTWPTLS